MGVEENDKKKLYIRLPINIRDEFQVKELHPNIVEVHLPRQKSRRWCVVDFEDQKKLEEAHSVLKKLKINNKSIKISAYKKSKKEAKPEIKSSDSLVNLLKKSS